MRRQFGWAWASLVALTMAMIAGCDQAPAPQAPVTGRGAVIDLQKVAEGTAWKRKIEDEINQRRTQLTQELSASFETMKKKYEEEKAKYGEKPTEEQQQQLNQLALQAQQLQQRNQQTAAQILQRLQNDLNGEFLARVKPIAEELAKQRGYSVVHVSNYILYSEPTVDITNDVITELNKSGTGVSTGGTTTPGTTTPGTIPGLPGTTPGLPPVDATGTTPGTVPGLPTPNGVTPPPSNP